MGGGREKAGLQLLGQGHRALVPSLAPPQQQQQRRRRRRRRRGRGRLATQKAVPLQGKRCWIDGIMRLSLRLPRGARQQHARPATGRRRLLSWGGSQPGNFHARLQQRQRGQQRYHLAVLSPAPVFPSRPPLGQYGGTRGVSVPTERTEGHQGRGSGKGVEEAERWKRAAAEQARRGDSRA